MESVFRRGAWSVAGAQAALDRGTTVLGTLTASAKGKLTITLNAAGIAVVQKWVNNPAVNFGFAIQNYNNANAVVFDSREATAVANRPKLTVGYTLPAPAMTANAGPIRTSSKPMAPTCTVHFPTRTAPRCQAISRRTGRSRAVPPIAWCNLPRNGLESSVTFTDPGTYVLRLTIDDGVQSSFAEVTIIVELGETT